MGIYQHIKRASGSSMKLIVIGALTDLAISATKSTVKYLEANGPELAEKTIIVVKNTSSTLSKSTKYKLTKTSENRKLKKITKQAAKESKQQEKQTITKLKSEIRELKKQLKNSN
ncbi:hypothetical protein [Carnobacterium divergens]|uniref:hypothetical protein n=1 Tax=Carnobacterium divergens TaxID=2748 RepID=UPI0039B091CF